MCSAILWVFFGWLFYLVGCFFWLLLFVVFKSRIIFLRKNLSHRFQLRPWIWWGQIYEILLSGHVMSESINLGCYSVCMWIPQPLPDNAKGIGIPFRVNPGGGGEPKPAWKILSLFTAQCRIDTSLHVISAMNRLALAKPGGA